MLGAGITDVNRTRPLPSTCSEPQGEADGQSVMLQGDQFRNGGLYSSGGLSLLAPCHTRSPSPTLGPKTLSLQRLQPGSTLTSANKQMCPGEELRGSLPLADGQWDGSTPPSLHQGDGEELDESSGLRSPPRCGHCTFEEKCFLSDQPVAVSVAVEISYSGGEGSGVGEWDPITHPQ